MTTEEIIAVWGAIAAVIATVVAVLSFFLGRKNSTYRKGVSDESLKSDIKYMRNSFDDLRLDVKELVRKQDDQSERIARLEESTKQMVKRVDMLEKRVNRDETE